MFVTRVRFTAVEPMAGVGNLLQGCLILGQHKEELDEVDFDLLLRRRQERRRDWRKTLTGIFSCQCYESDDFALQQHGQIGG